MEIISRKEAVKKGLVRYFTGKPCSKDHISERHTKSRACLMCRAELVRKRSLAKKLANNQVPFLNPKLYFPTPKLPREIAKEKGLKWYITGIPCPHDHCCERQVATCICRECKPRLKKEKSDWDKKRYATDEEFRKGRLAQTSKYRKENLDKIKEYEKNNRDKINARARDYLPKKRATDLNFRLRERYRIMVHKALTRKNVNKSNRTRELLGCDEKFLKKHLESLFTEEMSWENWNQFGWHIDHIRPCQSFDFESIEQRKVSFNWRNLQPLWASENTSKRDDYTEEDEKLWVKKMRDLGFEGELFLKY